VEENAQGFDLGAALGNIFNRGVDVAASRLVPNQKPATKPAAAPPPRNFTPWIIGGVVVALVAVAALLFMRK
jgi:hypothetical protein